MPGKLPRSHQTHKSCEINQPAYALYIPFSANSGRSGTIMLIMFNLLDFEHGTKGSDFMQIRANGSSSVRFEPAEFSTCLPLLLLANNVK